MRLIGHFTSDKTFTQPIVWLTTFFMVAFHVGAFAALFFFSWKAFLLAMLWWWVAGSLGIGMGYHRLLTHRGYKTPRWVEYFLTVCGTLALEGGPIFWVATHRLHHQNTDREGNPHSPHDGGFWAHMGWILTGQTMHNNATELLAYVPELRKDRFHSWISRWHWVPITVLGALIFLIGGWRYLLWGVFLRTVIGLHSTWLVNSATHMWGRQRFSTHDDSRNSFWVALLTFRGGLAQQPSRLSSIRPPRHGMVRIRSELVWNFSLAHPGSCVGSESQPSRRQRCVLCGRTSSRGGDGREASCLRCRRRTRDVKKPATYRTRINHSLKKGTGGFNVTNCRR